MKFQADVSYSMRSTRATMLAHILKEISCVCRSAACEHLSRCLRV